MPWVYDPHSGGVKIPKRTKESTEKRILTYAQKHYAITPDIKECNQNLFHKVQLHHPTHRLSLNQLPNIFLQIGSHV